MTSILIILGTIGALALLLFVAGRIERKRDRRLEASYRRHKERMEALDELRRQLEHVTARRRA